jgi:hypothetical protein
MLTFKDFLNERAKTRDPKYSPVDLSDAIKTIKSHCRDAMWMISEDRPLYRGERNETTIKKLNKTGCLAVDPSKTERASQNTSNFYTLIFDNIPSMKDYPKRSRSFIASTSFGRAEQYTHNTDDVMIMIPYNGVKIGIVPEEDIWDIKINLFNRERNLPNMNRTIFTDLNLSSTDWSKWIEFDKLLKAGGEAAYNRLGHAISFGQADKHRNDFLETVMAAYSPEETGFECCTTEDFPHDARNNEVWVSGPVLLISLNMWADIKEELS